MRHRDPSRLQLLAPRYWAVRIGIWVMRLLILLPFRAQMALGRGLGRLAWRFARRERHIGEINLRLCLQDLGVEERTRLLKHHFGYLGCGLFDSALAWWASDERILRLTQIEGAERLERALQAGRGALLVTAHFTAAEMGVRALAPRYRIGAMYQTPRNALVAEQFRACHRLRTARMIPSDNVRELLRALKDRLPVWFAADQRESMRSSTLAPFFGIPVVSNTAPARIARMTRAPVLPYAIEHVEHGRDGAPGYRVSIGEPLESFPSNDDVADAARLHAVVEAQVRLCPAQYLWTYKRFKRSGFDPYKK